MAHVPGPMYAGLIVQETFVPAGNASLSVAPATAPPALVLTVIVKFNGLPGVTVPEAGVLVTVKLPTFAGGNATTTSLNCLVRAVIAASTFLFGSNAVVMSNSNWQKIAGLVAIAGLPTSIGVLQFVPNGEVGETA